MGCMMRECVLKRFYWRDDDQNRFFTYQSSIPDRIYEFSNEYISRYDILHQTTCFRGIGINDLLVEQVFQVDFRELNSILVLDQYIGGLRLQAIDLQTAWLKKATQL